MSFTRNPLGSAGESDVPLVVSLTAPAATKETLHCVGPPGDLGHLGTLIM